MSKNLDGKSKKNRALKNLETLSKEFKPTLNRLYSLLSDEEKQVVNYLAINEKSNSEDISKSMNLPINIVENTLSSLSKKFKFIQNENNTYNLKPFSFRVSIINNILQDEFSAYMLYIREEYLIEEEMSIIRKKANKSI